MLIESIVEILLSYEDKVYAIGNGNNYGISITEGIISNPKFTVELSNKSVIAI